METSPLMILALTYSVTQMQYVNRTSLWVSKRENKEGIENSIQ